MKIDQQTFCAAPWFQVRQSMNGTFKSCCVIDHNHSEYKGEKNFKTLEQWLESDYLKYLKQNLNAGNRLSECQHCWKKERTNLISLRQIINDTVTDKRAFDQSWLHFYFKNKENFDHDLILSADIKTSNLCNFACAMCTPQDSSRIESIWKKNKGHQLVNEVLLENKNYFEDIDLIYREGKSYSLIKSILDMKPRHLKLLGGEPLLDSTLLNLLDNYKDKKLTNLVFITNGSVDFTTIAARLHEYKTVSIILSLEGVDLVQDYVRRGSDWNYINQNVHNYIKNFGTKNLYIQHTLQCLTFGHLHHLLEWSKNLNLQINVGFLNDPAYLSFDAMPQELLNNICEQLQHQNCSLATFDDVENLQSITVPNLVRLVQENYCYNSALTSKLRIFLDWYDPENKWKKILPEWNQYL
jgi:organic radical activating enzyme